MLNSNYKKLKGVNMSKLIIYTDGGCRGNGKDNNIGGWGAILIYNSLRKEIYGGFKNTTNNRMEITGVIEALKLINFYNVPIEIYSDSAYVVNCIKDKWYIGWQKNGWKNSKKQPVENKDLWEELIKLIGQFQSIEFIKVKGHAGIDGNEAVDALVNKAMDELGGN
jgi:ribonuclease HI